MELRDATLSTHSLFWPPPFSQSSGPCVPLPLHFPYFRFFVKLLENSHNKSLMYLIFNSQSRHQTYSWAFTFSIWGMLFLLRSAFSITISSSEIPTKCYDCGYTKICNFEVENPLITWVSKNLRHFHICHIKWRNLIHRTCDKKKYYPRR